MKRGDRKERNTLFYLTISSSARNMRINPPSDFFPLLSRIFGAVRLTASRCARSRLTRLDRLLLQTRIAVKNANARLIAFQPHFRRPLRPEPFQRSLRPCETIVGVRRTGSSARPNDAEDNGRSPALTPKEMER